MGFNIGGLIAGALKGGSEGVGTVAAMDIQQNQKLDYAKQLSDMDEVKQGRIADAQASRDLINKPLQAMAMIPSAFANETQVGAVQTKNAVARAEALAPIAVDVASKSKKAELDVERTDTIAKGADGNYLKAVKALTNAKQTGLEGIQAAIGMITLENAKMEKALKDEYINPNTTPEQRENIHKNLLVLTGKDNENFLPIAVKDSTGMPTGEYQIFDKRRGTMVGASTNTSAGAGPWNNPGATATATATSTATSPASNKPGFKPPAIAAPLSMSQQLTRQEFTRDSKTLTVPELYRKYQDNVGSLAPDQAATINGYRSNNLESRD